MRQIAQNYKSGALGLVDVTPPALQSGTVLVRTAFSLVSPGTEGTKVNEAKMNLLQKARARPDHVRKVLQSMRQQGIRSTYNKVMNKLDSLTPLGYSASGVIEAIGDGVEGFHLGQNVAIAGAGYANHAEMNVVPQQLVAAVPEAVGMDHAAFTTMGMIAMHGFRQSDMRLGEVAVVIGLGMVGQLVAQIATAAGMRVVGIDVDAERCRIAKETGCMAAGVPGDAALADIIKRASGGAGADAVFLCLGSQSNQPLEDAIGYVRDRGRVVCVGMAKMDLPYGPSFKKEVEFRFSRSYGPGRYDPNYEEKGQDYPIGYVRWTEGRNMQAVLDLMQQGKLHLDALIQHRVPFAQAPDYYEAMHQERIGGLGILFDYTQEEAPSEPMVRLPGPGAVKRNGQLGIGCIGVGNYAASMLLPNIKENKRTCLVEVANATSLSSKNAADKFGFNRFSTDVDALLKADDIDAVIIATRHASHADIAQRALEAGKAVFVEKPLAIKPQELDALEATLKRIENPKLHVGFNRRFSPCIQDMKDALPSGSPLVMHYRVHAGALDASHWVRSPEEGGRFIGEAGHFLDVFAYLCEAEPVQVSAQRFHANQPMDDDGDNRVVMIQYSDGSLATLHYLCQGGEQLPKEFLEVSGGGVTAIMNNFAELTIYAGRKRAKTTNGYGNLKGQKQQMQAVLNAWLNDDTPMPTPRESLMQTSWLTLAAEQATQDNVVISLKDYIGRD